MPIPCLGKFAGFGASFVPVRGSLPVWETLKEFYGQAPSVMEQIKLYRRSVPGLSDLYQAALKYDRRYTTKPKHDPILDQVLEEARTAFSPPTKVPLRHINDMTEKDFPMSTSPCLPYVQRGIRTKKEAYQQAKFDARLSSHRIKEELPTKLPPSMVFAKGKICTKDVIKTRAIWGKSFMVLIMQAIFYLNLWKFYLLGTTPMAYGYKPYRGGFRKLEDDLFHSGFREGKTLAFGMDFVAYDTSLPPWLLFECYKIFASYLDFDRYEFHGKPDPSRTERLFWRLCRESVSTPFLMPDGYLFVKHGGVDSGAFDFQLVECMCTWIMIRYALLKMQRKYLFLTTMGDDSLCVLADDYPLDFEAVNNILKEIFGVEVNASKSYQTRFYEEIKFLGRYLRSKSFRKPTVDTVLAALYPAKTDVSPIDTAERLIALFYDTAGSSPPAARFLKSCFMKIEPAIRDLGYLTSIHSWSNRWMKKFAMWGMSPPKYLKLPSNDVLYHLLYSDKEYERIGHYM